MPRAATSAVSPSKFAAADREQGVDLLGNRSIAVLQTVGQGCRQEPAVAPRRLLSDPSPLDQHHVQRGMVDAAPAPPPTGRCTHRRRPRGPHGCLPTASDVAPVGPRHRSRAPLVGHPRVRHRGPPTPKLPTVGYGPAMRAVVCESFAEPEDLEVRQLDTPPCGPGQVRVHVWASGVNYVDALFVQGRYQIRPPLPFVPGQRDRRRDHRGRATPSAGGTSATG